MNNKTRSKAGPNKRPQPKKLHQIFELARAARDATLYMVFSNAHKHVPQGDGHPVLVLPGFLSHDRDTVALRGFIRRLGYAAETWNGPTNFGPSDDIMAHLHRRFNEVYEKHGRQPVSIVGWSLGGVYAHELAKRYPQKIRNVITLGSPHSLVEDFHTLGGQEGLVNNETRIPAALRMLFNFLNPDGVDAEKHFSPDVKCKVPITSVYTRYDGVVHWSSSILKEGPTTENIEINTSHLGLGFSLQGMTVIADRLRQKKGDWKPFRPQDYPLAMIRPRRHHKHRKHGLG